VTYDLQVIFVDEFRKNTEQTTSEDGSGETTAKKVITFRGSDERSSDFFQEKIV